MYEVFFNDRIVFINTSFNKSLINDQLFYDSPKPSELIDIYNLFVNDKLQRNLFLQSDNVENLKDLFFSQFKIIIAAGGLVVNSKDELLCIYRLNKWDLPKGKVEKNEHIEDAAIREVEEETGIDNLILKQLFTITYHIYKSPYHKNRWVLKPTYWYSMYYDGDLSLVPQTEEGITEVKWMNRDELEHVKQDTYSSLRHLFKIPAAF